MISQDGKQVLQIRKARWSAVHAHRKFLNVDVAYGADERADADVECDAPEGWRGNTGGRSPPDAPPSQHFEWALQLPDPRADQRFRLRSRFRRGVELPRRPSEDRLPADPHGGGQLGLPERAGDQPAPGALVARLQRSRE